MKVLGRNILHEFGQKHADAASALSSWLHEAEEAQWVTPADLKGRFSSASILSGSRVVINIKGNNYRLDIKINYASQVILVKRIGTHSEYEKWTF